LAVTTAVTKILRPAKLVSYVSNRVSITKSVCVAYISIRSLMGLGGASGFPFSREKQKARITSSGSPKTIQYPRSVDTDKSLESSCSFLVNRNKKHYFEQGLQE
jgi:hypothetical protein